jgi:uncharacterized OsmC-like protein
VTVNPVEIELLENGDYYIKLNHDALEDIEVSLSRVPEDKRGGVARAFFSASALYCMAGSVNYMLRARNVQVKDIDGSVSIKMGKDGKGRDLVESMILNIDVDVPDENVPELDRCIKYLEDGCLITRGLKKGIVVTNNIQRMSK